jgi:CrcB protein
METRPISPIVRREFAAVFVGGVVGTLLRAGLLQLFPFENGTWPWATFLANLAACVALGYVLTSQRQYEGAPVRVALLGTGVCGALSTFSTLQLEIYEMVDAGDILLAAGYLASGIFFGLLAVSVARRFAARAEDLA